MYSPHLDKDQSIGIVGKLSADFIKYGKPNLYERIKANTHTHANQILLNLSKKLFLLQASNLHHYENVLNICRDVSFVINKYHTVLHSYFTTLASHYVKGKVA